MCPERSEDRWVGDQGGCGEAHERLWQAGQKGGKGREVEAGCTTSSSGETQRGPQGSRSREAETRDSLVKVAG